GDQPQAKAADAGATVTDVKRTQNGFVVEVDAAQPTRILLNTTYDKGWRASVGTVVDHDKELAVDVPAGRHHLLVRYRPKTLTLGMVLTALGLVGAVGGVVFLTKKRRRTQSS